MMKIVILFYVGDLTALRSLASAYSITFTEKVPTDLLGTVCEAYAAAWKEEKGGNTFKMYSYL